MTGDLTGPAVLRGLTTAALGRRLHMHADVGSTNDLALDRADAGAPHGTAVVADQQLRGRGQRGRGWHSPPGLGLYTSLVLRGERELVSPTLVIAAIGVGIAEGIEQIADVRAEVKWPNDVWIGRKKIAGVLVESRGYRPTQPVLVAGFGVNVNHSAVDFPPELEGVATSLAVETGDRLDRSAVLRAVLTALEPWIDVALAGRAEALEEVYRSRSSVLGQRVSLLDGATRLTGHVADLGAADGLLLRLADGSHVRVRAEHAREVRLI